MSSKYQPKPDMEFVTGIGYVEKEPRPRVFLSEQGRPGARGNVPYRRPARKLPVSNKALRHAIRAQARNAS